MSEKTNDGGSFGPTMRYETDECGGATATPEGGISVRDYFASQALIGTLANPDISASAARCGVSTEDFRSDVARAAYHMADAMLKAREASS